MNTVRWITAVVVSAIIGFGTASFIARKHAAATPSATTGHAQPTVDCTHASDKDWHTFQLFGYDSYKYIVESQMCIGDEGGDEVDFKRVRVTDDKFTTVFFTYDNDEILRIENAFLLANDTPQLFIMTGSGGTGDEEDWQIIGETGGKLKEWAKPDYDRPAQKLLHPDETFCCKDWNLHLQGRDIFLARGIYRNGDGNCCPTRGGILVHLTPYPHELKISSMTRISKDEYYRWWYKPFCSECTLQ